MYIAPQSKDKSLAALPAVHAELSIADVCVLVGSRRETFFAERFTFGGADGGGDPGVGVGDVVELVLVGVRFRSVPSLGSREGELLLGGRGVEWVDEHFFGIHELLLKGRQLPPGTHLIIFIQLIKSPHSLGRIATLLPLWARLTKG